MVRRSGRGLTDMLISLLVAIGLLTGFAVGVIFGNAYRRELLIARFRKQLPFSWLQVARMLLPLGGRLGPFGRLAAYHARATSPGSDQVLWRTPAGDFWGRPKDDWFLGHQVREQYVWHLYDQPEIQVRRGDIVVDAGANLGVFTRFALNRGAELVIAIEPEPVNAACFKHTFADELRAGRVTLLEAALWRTGECLPFRGDGDAGAVVRGETGTHTFVRGISLDHALSEMKIQRIDMIKMDVEGAERQALDGARRTIATFTPRMAISIEHNLHDDLELSRLVEEINPAYRFTRGSLVLYCY